MHQIIRGVHAGQCGAERRSVKTVAKNDFGIFADPSLQRIRPARHAAQPITVSLQGLQQPSADISRAAGEQDEILTIHGCANRSRLTLFNREIAAHGQVIYIGKALRNPIAWRTSARLPRAEFPVRNSKRGTVEIIAPCLEPFFQSLSTAVSTEPFFGNRAAAPRCWFTAFPARRRRCARSERFSGMRAGPSTG